MRNLLFILILLIWWQAPAATFYIDYAAGSDSAAGTSTGAAWKHCPDDSNATGNAAAHTPTAGDTFVFKGGVSYLGRLVLDESGTLANPIVYDGNSAGTWGTGRAIMDGEYTPGDAFYVNFGVSHFKIVSFVIQHYGGYAEDNPLVIAANANEILMSCPFGGCSPSTSGNGIQIVDDRIAYDPIQSGRQRWDANALAWVPDETRTYFGNTNIWIENVFFFELGQWRTWGSRELNKGWDASTITGNGIRARGVRSMVVTNCEFSRCGLHGMEIAAAPELVDVHIVDCNFHESMNWAVDCSIVVSAARGVETSSTVRQTQSHEIQWNEKLENVKFERCRFENLNWSGGGYSYAPLGPDYMDAAHQNCIFFRTDDSPNPWTNVTVIACLFGDTNSPADVLGSGGTASIFLSKGPSVNIYNNVFSGPQNNNAMVTVGWLNPYSVVSTVRVYNNTFYQRGNVKGLQSSEQNSTLKKIYFENNIIVLNTTVPWGWASFHNIDSGCYPVVLDYNLYYSPNFSESSRYIDCSGLILSAYKAMGYEANGFWANPLFTSASTANWQNQDFRPLTNSPVFGRGRNLSAYFQTDKDGNLRPTTGAWSIGAYEVAGEAPPDTSGLHITGLTVAATATNATVTWTTDAYATSGLEYGTTTNYGTTLTNSSLVASHSFTLTNLTPATTYYVRVDSTDATTNAPWTNAFTSFTTDVTNRVATPTITAGISSLTNVNFEATCSTPGAVIYYTRDGTTPTTSSTLYEGTFQITSNVTIKVVAFKADWTNSPTVSSTFTVFALPTPDPSVPTNGMGVWFAAAAAFTNANGVSTWYDIGPNHRNATAFNNPLRINSVLNSQPVVRLNGTSQYLTFTNAVNGLTGVTIFIVAANSSDQDTLPANVGDAALFWNEIADWGTLYFSPLQRYLGIRFGTTQVNNNTLHTRPSSIGTAWTISAARKNGTTDQVFTNGTLAQTWTGRLGSIAGCRDTGNIGRGYNDNTYFNGDIAEILVYERALSDEEMTTVTGYLSEKYFNTEPPPEPPLPPVFSVAQGGYVSTNQQTNVTITVNATNQVAFWLDSQSVTLSNTPASVLVTNGQTLYAYATNELAQVGSSVAYATYTLTNPPLGAVATPTIYPASGVYNNRVVAWFDCETPGTVLLWSTNDWLTHEVGGSVTLNNSAFLIVRGTNANYRDSEDALAVYTITNAPLRGVRRLRAGNVRFSQ